jgi:2-amino-4-hydroxy-6-hydroxymethyldihydropteridine diphosphokinase
MPESRPVAVALGSNLGDRQAHLHHAVARLGQILTDLRVSGFVETAPEGGAPQPHYLNAAAVGRSAAPPADLLASFLTIEGERARTRPFPRAPRTLDLDLILVGDLIVTSPDLELPHPRFRDRRFVLAPLAEIAPDLVDPVTGLTIPDLLAQL